MSRISEVIKNKNRIEKQNRQNRKDKMSSVRQEAIFKAKLSNELKIVDTLLESNEVKSVTIEIPDAYMANFSIAIYSPELAEYKVEQVTGNPNKFRLSRRYIVY